MRLLFVDDDRQFSEVLTRHLIGEGHLVDWVSALPDDLSALQPDQNACLLLGLTLASSRSQPMLQRMRSLMARTPSLVFCNNQSLADRVALLDLGADDIISKPVDLREVSARIRAVTRRRYKDEHNRSEFRHGPLTFDVVMRVALWNDCPVMLTNKEFRVLEVLIENRNRILSRSQLEERLYGWDGELESNAVEVYIHFLRRKFSPSMIRTFRGVGYQLSAPETMEFALPGQQRAAPRAAAA